MTRRDLGKTRLLLPGRDMTWRAFATRLGQELVHDSVDDVAATVTFYAAAALFPLMLFVVSLVSRVASWDDIEGAVAVLSRVAPGEVTTLVSQRLAMLKQHPDGGIVTFGFVATLWSASAGVHALVPALNRAYDVVETRPFWRRRLLAIVVTVGVGAVAFAASLVAIVVPAVAHRLGGTLGAAIDWLRLPVAGFVMTLVVASLYTFLPNVRPRFQPVTPGSVVGVLLWVGASWGFGVYVRHFGGYEATYGALGGAIVLLLWMWVSVMAFLLGAEINKILMPRVEKEAVDTHVTNMPATAQAQEGDPALAREGLVSVSADVAQPQQ